MRTLLNIIGLFLGLLFVAAGAVIGLINLLVPEDSPSHKLANTYEASLIAMIAIAFGASVIWRSIPKKSDVNSTANSC